MKMKKCEECGKELKLLKGYKHPTMGKKYPICSPCFVQVSESVARWREFVLSNSFNNISSRNDLQLDWKKIMSRFTKIRDTFDTKKAE